jgi:hypothetical protein
MESAGIVPYIRPIALFVLVGGWAFAAASYFIIGTETCATTAVPLVGAVRTCADTTSTTYVVVAGIGFTATVGALILWTLGHLFEVIAPDRGER